MKFAPILPPMKPSAPAASNCADGAQHTAYRVPEAMFKLRLLTRSINDDAENLLTLNKKIGQALIRFSLKCSPFNGWQTPNLLMRNMLRQWQGR